MDPSKSKCHDLEEFVCVCVGYNDFKMVRLGFVELVISLRIRIPWDEHYFF